MGVVVEEKCPNCQETVYMPLHCHLMRCPSCKEADIINSRREKEKGSLTEKSALLMKKPHVFKSHKTKNATCPKCGTEFSCSPALSKGKIFCPKCSTPMALEQAEE
tara:strand:- start:1322 stop:1639 length:318 start_codon:yes stop_codon:yes gene_type:complete